MRYQWNGSHLAQVFVLSAEVVDQHIRLAGAAQLKVLLWFCRHGAGEFDAAACAAAIGLSAADCADAFQYWIATGVLLAEGDSALPSETSVVSAIAPSAAPAEPIKEAAKEPVKAVVPRPAPVHPQVKDVIRRQKDDGAFGRLLNEVSARLGRPITNADMTTLLYLYDNAGLPVEVLLTITAYAVSREKPHLRYIEKVALDWADRGIDTMAAAEEHLCRMDRRDQAWAKLETVLGIHKVPTASQMDRAEEWFCVRRLDESLIRRAYEMCLEKTGKFQMTYMARILEDWQESGIRTADQLQTETASQSKRKPPQVENTSLDMAAYEQMMDRLVPVYPDGKKE